MDTTEFTVLPPNEDDCSNALFNMENFSIKDLEGSFNTFASANIDSLIVSNVNSLFESSLRVGGNVFDVNRSCANPVVKIENVDDHFGKIMGEGATDDER